MSTTISCPSCQRLVSLPDELRGQEVQCPWCAAWFHAQPAPERPPTATTDFVTSVSSEPQPAAVPTRPRIEVAALPPWQADSAWQVRRDCEPHRGTLILILGIISLTLFSFGLLAPLGAPLGLSAWIMGHGDLKKMAAGVMDPQGQGSTRAGYVCGIVGTILDSLMLLGCGAYVGFIVWISALP
ncbi:MAG: hypothetical protein ACK4RK_04215 [Gemmataceae bacterium]